MNADEHIKELEKEVEHYRSHFEATLENWNLSLDRVKELEGGIEKHRKYTKRYDITPKHIKDILGNHDEELYKLIEKEKKQGPPCPLE